jgi:GT2 family glycosyltransferase
MQKITTILVTHNNYKTILRALDSLVDNIQKPDHIVIGDNESTDNTYEKLCETLHATKVNVGDKTGWTPKFTSKYKGISITIFRMRKTTTSNIINTAIQMTLSDTQIYTFLNPTDWYEPNKILDSIEVFSRNNRVVCVVTNCIHHLPDGRNLIDFKPSYDINQIHADYRYDENFVILANVFQRLGGLLNNTLDFMYDYELILRMTRLGLIYHIPKPLYHREIKNTPTSHDNNMRQLQQKLSSLSLSGKPIYG